MKERTRRKEGGKEIDQGHDALNLCFFSQTRSQVSVPWLLAWGPNSGFTPFTGLVIEQV